MSKLWTKREEAVLFEAMGDKKVMYAPKAREIAKKLPGRTPEAIRRHWLLIRWDCKPGEGHAALLRNKQEMEKRQLNRQIDMLLEIKPNADLSTIKQLLREAGLRGKVTIELGE